MRRAFHSGGGIYHPIIRVPGCAAMPYQNKWSREPGCFQLKSALAWAELSAITGDAELRCWFDEMLAGAVRIETSFLPGSADDLEVMNRIHAYCYYLEALLQCPEMHQKLAQGVTKAIGHLDRIAPRFERSDVCAQLLRIAILSGHDTAGLQSRTARYQFAENSGLDRQGGFCFGSRDGALLPMVNPVSTAFCMQALGMWESMQAGENPGVPAELI